MNPSTPTRPPQSPLLTIAPRRARAGRPALLIALTALMMLPVWVVLSSWLQWNSASAQVVRALASTVLPDYALTSLRLCVGVGVGVALVGSATALTVTLFEFPGRRWMRWALLLPLAMPAYVVAYGYTDFLQFGGPMHAQLSALSGRELAETASWLPEVRSVAGAAWVLSFTLYPYVYLLVRTALNERGAQLMEAARLLGASLPRRLWTIALPLTRPAMMAGVALALMETLADYGVSSYFGIQTFTAGIYKAWLIMDDRIAATQLAAILLALVAAVLWLEQRAQRKLRFVQQRTARQGGHEAQPIVLTRRGCLLAWAVCLVPLIAGFLAPVLFMLHPLIGLDDPLPWASYLQWGWHSLQLGLLGAVIAVSLALTLAWLHRRHQDRVTRAVVQIVGLGYAIPGAVVVVGLLTPLIALQAYAPNGSIGAILTNTIAGLLWAYWIRFGGVALQSLQSGYARIPINLDESARSLGSTPWALLRRVHWPLLKPTTAAASLLVMVDIMKELPATLVLRPFNHDTLAVMAYQLARDERLGEAALPCLALVAVGLIPVLLLNITPKNPDRTNV